MHVPSYLSSYPKEKDKLMKERYEHSKMMVVATNTKKKAKKKVDDTVVATQSTPPKMKKVVHQKTRGSSGFSVLSEAAELHASPVTKKLKTTKDTAYMYTTDVCNFSTPPAKATAAVENPRQEVSGLKRANTGIQEFVDFDSTATDATNTPSDSGEPASEAYRLMLSEDVLNFDWNETSSEEEKDFVSATVSSSQLLTSNGISCYNHNMYTEILCILILNACPDFNNLNEYVIKNDGMTRTALSTPALMRYRIKVMLQQHQVCSWWKDSVLIESPPVKTTYCVEHLFALAAVMHDTSKTWTTLVDKAELTNDFTASKFDEEDDILQIGQMLACLWERANRFLSRDTYIKLGKDGMERVSVFKKILRSVVVNSRMVDF